MGTTPLIEKLKTELAKVGNEVGWLWVHHRVFWDIAEIYNTTPRLQEAQTVFFDWMYFSYIEAGCIGIRRQDDTNPDSISLINVLTEIEQNAMVLTKERFVDLLSWMPGHPFFEDPGNKERRIEAERKFDQMFGNGMNHIDPEIVRADITLLKATVKSIRQFVNKEIAHTDRRGMKGIKPTGDIFEECLTCIAMN